MTHGPSAPPIAAVTGASRGIGRATALGLARQGYRVFALARSVSDLECLTEEARGERLEIIPLKMDIADDDSRRTAIETLRELTDGYGLDVLVNNAGYGQLGPVEEISIDKIRRQFEVNLFGLHAFTQAFLPQMRQRGRGRVVNLSSIAGRISSPFMGVYSASKFALEGLSDAMRLELSPFGVHVILIEPGPIRTAFGEAAQSFLPPSAESPYAPYRQGQRRARKSTDLFERSPQAVARVIVRAVGARYPRPRYTVTLPAKLGALARRLVPDVLADWAFRFAMSLHPGK